MISIANSPITQVFFGGIEIKEVYKGSDLIYQKGGGVELIVASAEALAIPLQIGDAIKLNDGMGINEFAWNAYPTNTTTKGEFTIDSSINSIEEIEGNTIYNAEIDVPTNETTISVSEENAQVIYYGNGERANIKIAVSQDGAEISSFAGITTSAGLIQGYRILHCENLTGYDIKLQTNGQNLETGKFYLVDNNSVLAILLKYNGNFAYYGSLIVSRDIILKRHTFKVISSGNVSIYGQQINQIECYSGQVISYSVDGTTYSFTIPQNSSSNMIYEVNV